MAVNLGSAYGEVVLDASGATKGLDSAKGSLTGFQSTLDSVSDRAGRAGQKLSLGVSLPLLAVGTGAVLAASDLEESLSKVNVVFGENAAAVEEWSETTAEALGLSQQEALEAAGTFGNLFSALGLGQADAQALSVDLVELSSDLASFNNLDPTDVLVKLRSGLVGEVEPLRTLGVNLNAATVEAKALELGLAETSDELTASHLVQARYALILEQTTNAQGDFARTSEGLANQTRITKAQLKDAAAELGENLLPVVTKVVGVVSDLVSWFTDLPEPVQRAGLVVGGLAAALGPLLVGVSAVASGVSAVVGVVGALSGVFAAVGGVVAAVAGVVGAALLPVLAVVAAVAAVAALLYLAWSSNFLGLRDVVTEVWGHLRGVFEGVKQVVTDVVSFLKGELTFDELKERVTTSLAGVSEAWKNAWETLKTWFSGLWEGLQEVVGRAFEALKELVVGALAGWLEPVFGSLEEARAVVEGAFDNLLAFLEGVWEAVRGGAEAAWAGVQAVVEGAVEGVRVAVAAVLSVLSGDWVGAVQELWDFTVEAFEGVLSTVETVLATVVTVVTESWNTVVGAVEGALAKVTEVVTAAWEGVKDVWAKLTGADEEEEPKLVDPAEVEAQAAAWQQLVADLTLAWEQAELVVTTVATRVRDYLVAWSTAVETQLSTHWQRVLTSARVNWTAVQNTLVNAASNTRDEVVRLFKDLRDDVNTVFRKLRADARRAGQAVGDALAAGLRSRVGAVRAAAQALARAARVNLPGSDAQEGPLSDLSAAGRALPETLAEGVLAGQGALLQAVQATVSSVAGELGGLQAVPAAVPFAAAPVPAAAGVPVGGPPATGTVNVYVDRVDSELDVYDLAYQVLEVANWRAR